MRQPASARACAFAFVPRDNFVGSAGARGCWRWGRAARRPRSPLHRAVTAPIHRAAAKGDVEVLRLELDGGTDVDLANEEGWTALHHSIAQGHLPASKLLLQSGAEVNRKHHGKRTALHEAAERDDVEAVKLLMQFGAKIDERNRSKPSAAPSAAGAPQAAPDRRVARVLQTAIRPRSRR